MHNMPFARPPLMYSYDRQEGIEMCHDIARAIPLNASGRTVILITAGGDVGKSFVADGLLNFFDDNQDKGTVPRDNKMRLEPSPGYSLTRPCFDYISHNEQFLKFTVVRKTDDFKRLPEEDCPEIVVFMQTGAPPLHELKPDITINIKKSSDLFFAGGDMPLEWAVAIPEKSKLNTPEMNENLKGISEKSAARLVQRGISVIPKRPTRPRALQP